MYIALCIILTWTSEHIMSLTDLFCRYHLFSEEVKKSLPHIVIGHMRPMTHRRLTKLQLNINLSQLLCMPPVVFECVMKSSLL